MILRTHRLVENEAVRLAEIAIDPDECHHVRDAWACPGCGTTAFDLLPWNEGYETVTCTLCETTFGEDVIR